ncbi:MAG: 50S ribosomal protein L3 N(5)-glutamine methyltransferase [Pseudomonadota bacterium]
MAYRRAMFSPESMSRDLAAAASGAAVLELLTQCFAAAPLAYGHGTDNAADEAAWLFAAVAGVDYAEADWVDRFEAALAAPAVDLDIARMAALADQRVATRQPLAYLLGEAWFAGLRFEVTADVLVPRSPIAELIAAGYAPWVRPSEVRRVLEIGTGSGCIAIATALALPDAQVDATDVSPGALAVAQRNVARHGVVARVRLVASDLFTSATLGRYDLIVTNPPYVDAGDMASRPAEFRHEPELGLAAGADGLSIVRRLLAEAGSSLEPGGVLICEVGNSAEALQQEYATVPFTWLTFEHGGQGVFALTREQLEEHAPAIAAAVGRGSENT